MTWLGVWVPVDWSACHKAYVEQDTYARHETHQCQRQGTQVARARTTRETIKKRPEETQLDIAPNTMQ
jgi:hypothetical protein